MRSTRPRPVPFRSAQQPRTQASSRARLACPAATSSPAAATKRGRIGRKLRASLHLTRVLDSVPPPRRLGGQTKKLGGLESKNRRASAAAWGAHGIPIFLSLSLARVACVLLGWLAGWLVRRLPSPPETFSLSSPFGLVVALSYASSEESYRPVSFPYGRLIASFKRRGGAWERASERVGASERARAWARWFLREATRRKRRGGGGVRSVRALPCLASPGWLVLVGFPLATGQADGQISVLALGRAAAVGFGSARPIPCSLATIRRGLPPWRQQASRIEARVRGLETGTWIWRQPAAPRRRRTGR